MVTRAWQWASSALLRPVFFGAEDEGDAVGGAGAEMGCDVGGGVSKEPNGMLEDAVADGGGA